MTKRTPLFVIELTKKIKVVAEIWSHRPFTNRSNPSGRF